VCVCVCVCACVCVCMCVCVRARARVSNVQALSSTVNVETIMLGSVLGF
jgi:hypothetical protein